MKGLGIQEWMSFYFKSPMTAPGLYPEHDLLVDRIDDICRESDPLKRQTMLRDIRRRYPEKDAALIAAKTVGVPRKSVSHTLIGLQRLHHLERCAETVFAEGIAGDFLEAGVWRGGATVFLRALQVSHGESHRKVWAADSFMGLPKPSVAEDVASGLDLSAEKHPWLSIGRNDVKETFRLYDLLDEGVRFIPGWFHESLAVAPVERLSILRIDADIYESTLCALETLHEKVVPGGFVIVDDYSCLEPCRQAVDAFRVSREISSPLQRADWTSVFWRKEA